MLQKFAVIEIPGVGAPFDPNVHEAVVREVTTGHKEGEILDEYRKGYKLKDRLSASFPGQGRRSPGRTVRAPKRKGKEKRNKRAIVSLSTTQGDLMITLVSHPRNTMTFADGACEGRSRSEEEAMQGHRRRRETQRSSATSISPKGGGGTVSISLSLLLRDAHRHRVVVASRTRRRRARHKCYGIPGTRH